MKPPYIVARDDSTGTPKGEPIDIDILGNDEFSEENGITTITVITDPLNGTVEINSEGIEDISVTYTPDPDFVGIDSFEYILCDEVPSLGDTIICDTAWVVITVVDDTIGTPDCEFIVPQGFSPNGDGTNEEFLVGNLEDFENCFPNSDPPHLIIFNRWGDIVFEDKAYSNNNPWNGRYQGSRGDVPDGTYFYILWYEDNDGGMQDNRGFVEIKR